MAVFEGIGARLKAGFSQVRLPARRPRVRTRADELPPPPKLAAGKKRRRQTAPARSANGEAPVEAGARAFADSLLEPAMARSTARLSLMTLALFAIGAGAFAFVAARSGPLSGVSGFAALAFGAGLAVSGAVFLVARAGVSGARARIEGETARRLAPPAPDRDSLAGAYSAAARRRFSVYLWAPVMALGALALALFAVSAHSGAAPGDILRRLIAIETGEPGRVSLVIAIGLAALAPLFLGPLAALLAARRDAGAALAREPASRALYTSLPGEGATATPFFSPAPATARPADEPAATPPPAADWRGAADAPRFVDAGFQAAPKVWRADAPKTRGRGKKEFFSPGKTEAKRGLFGLKNRRGA